MKKIVVLAGANETLRKEYAAQLRKVLGRVVTIREYVIGKDKEEIDGDMVLAITYSAVSLVKQNSKDLPLRILKTFFTQDSVLKLKQIPPKTKALLISYEWAYLMESIALLGRLGINNIEFEPFYDEIKDKIIENVDLGIYIGSEYFKPNFIKNFINLGWREIIPECYEEILTCLHIDPSLIHNELEQVRERMPYAGLNIDINFLMSDFGSRSKIQRILDAIPMGILVIDDYGNVEVYNNYICTALKITMTELIGKRMRDEPKLTRLYESLQGNLHENLYYTDQWLEKEYIIKRRSVSFLGEKYQDIIIWEESPKGQDFSLNQKVQKSLQPKYTFSDIIGSSPIMQSVNEFAKKYALIDATVLILGETGTGKELYAHAIHNYSKRKNKPFISINCAAIPNELLESELFGYEKGTFTGANKEGKKGLFEIANGGTIFLDEIGDANPLFQVKLLRVLQEKEIIKLGGYKKIPLDIRIVAATNKQIDDLKTKSDFRRDLFYRLSTCVLTIPSLREHKEDIPELVQYYLKCMGAGNKILSKKLKNFLTGYKWDGNVRELKNCVEYLGYFGHESMLIEDLPMTYLQVAQEESIQKQGLIPEDHTIDHELLIEILTEINRKSCGRRQIFKQMQFKNQNISEYHIRKALDFLEKEHYIQKNTGRSGSEITEKGRNILMYSS